MKGEVVMKFEISDGWTMETNDPVLIEVLTVIEHVKAVIKAYNELPYEEVLEATNYDWHELANLMDAVNYDDEYEMYYDLVRNYYWLEHSVSSEAYRQYAEADFLEYASHKNEPDFDWDFYSDWHKDIYGFRPRW